MTDEMKQPNDEMNEAKAREISALGPQSLKYSVFQIGEASGYLLALEHERAARLGKVADAFYKGKIAEMERVVKRFAEAERLIEAADILSAYARKESSPEKEAVILRYRGLRAEWEGEARTEGDGK